MDQEANANDQITVKVKINGTNTNPWERYNLRMNPFPQIAKAEYTRAMLALNSLDGDPVGSENDIRSRLRGFSEEFIQLCINNWQPGKRTEFTVSFPE